MNIFRLKQNDELKDKLESYEVLIKDLQLGFDTLTEEVKNLTEKLVEKESVIQEKILEVETLETEVETLETIVDEKDTVIEEVIVNTMEVDKLAAVKAMEILADCGTPIMETIDAPEEIDIMAQMKSMKGNDLIEFYQKHKAEISKNFK